LKKADEEENKRENVNTALHIVKFKKSKLIANVVGAFSMSRHLSYDNTDLPNNISQEGYKLGSVVPKTEQQKKMLTVISIT